MKEIVTVYVSTNWKWQRKKLEGGKIYEGFDLSGNPCKNYETTELIKIFPKEGSKEAIATRFQKPFDAYSKQDSTEVDTFSFKMEIELEEERLQIFKERGVVDFIHTDIIDIHSIQLMGDSKVESFFSIGDRENWAYQSKVGNKTNPPLKVVMQGLIAAFECYIGGFFEILKDNREEAKSILGLLKTEASKDDKADISNILDKMIGFKRQITQSFLKKPSRTTLVGVIRLAINELQRFGKELKPFPHKLVANSISKTPFVTEAKQDTHEQPVYANPMGAYSARTQTQRSTLSQATSKPISSKNHKIN